MNYIIISYTASRIDHRHDEYDSSEFRVDNFSDENEAIKHVAKMEFNGSDENEIISPESFSEDPELASHEYQWRDRIDEEVGRLRAEWKKNEAAKKAQARKEAAALKETEEREKLRELKKKYPNG